MAATPARPPYSDIADFAARALALDEAYAPLRVKHEHRQTVLNNLHSIAVPEGYAGRAFPSYTGKAAEKRDLAITKLTNDDGVQVTVAKFGDGDGPEKRRERVQNFCRGMLDVTEERYGGTWYARNAEDCLVSSSVVARVMPAESMWSDPPMFDEAGLAAIEEDDVAAKAAADELIARQDDVKRRNPPIAIEFVPSIQVIAESDRYDRPVAAWQFSRMGVREVLRTWQKNGRPCAWELFRWACQQAGRSDPGPRDGDWEGDIDPEITDEDQVSVVHYADARYYRVAVLGETFQVAGSGDERGDVSGGAGTDEFVWESEHAMGVCPYAIGYGRLTVSRNPVRKFHSFIDPIVWAPSGSEDGPQHLSLVEQLDHLVTQRNSTARQIAWSSPLVKPAASPQALLPGTTDRRDPLTLEEGRLNYLNPGEDLVAPTLMSSSDAAVLERAIAECKQEIDLKTFGPVSYGASSGESGYDTAQMLGSAEAVLEPFRTGLGAFYAAVLQRVLAAARVVIARTGEPITVRYLDDEEGEQWATITEQLAKPHYAITCEITPQPVGGEMAWVETCRKYEEYGYWSHEEAVIAARNRNPSRTKRQRMIESLDASQGRMQIFEQYYVQRLAGNLLRPKPPDLGGVRGVRAALAQVLQSPELRTRMGMDTGLGGTDLGPTAMASGATPGLPDMQSYLPPMNPPTPAGAGAGTSGGGVPGSRFGQAQGMPGGAAQMSDVLAKSGVAV